MDEQKTQEAPADKATMPAWGWIAIIVLVAAVVALLMLKQQPQPQPLGEGVTSQPAPQMSQPQGGVSVPSTPAVPESGAAAKPVSQPVNFDAELKSLDMEANSVSENNFDENDLSDANLGI